MKRPPTFRRLLSDRLEALNMTRADLRADLKSHEIMISRQALDAWFDGRNQPRTEIVPAVIRALRVPDQDLPAWSHALGYSELISVLSPPR